jgi:hypothetical protein
MMGREWLVWLGFLLAACSAQPAVPPPPPAPRVEEPALAIPADLDLVARIDLTRLRAALGLDGSSVVQRVLGSARSDAPDAPTSRLLVELFLHAETAWAGVRPGSSAELTDNAVVLRGDFHGLLPNELGGEPRWRRPQDLGGGWLRFEREPPPLRAAPSVLYFEDPGLVVIGSVAEIDPLERILVDRDGDAPLRAPDAGLLAVSARIGPLRHKLSERAPTLGRLLSGAEKFQGNLDRVGDHFLASLELRFEDRDRAALAADALKSLQELLAGEGEWIRRAHVESLNEYVSLRTELAGAELARLFEERKSQ